MDCLTRRPGVSNINFASASSLGLNKGSAAKLSACDLEGSAPHRRLGNDRVVAGEERAIFGGVNGVIVAGVGGGGGIVTIGGCRLCIRGKATCPCSCGPRWGRHSRPRILVNCLFLPKFVADRFGKELPGERVRARHRRI